MPALRQFTDERHGRVAGDYVLTAPSGEIVGFAVATTSAIGSVGFVTYLDRSGGNSRIWDFIHEVERMQFLPEDWNGYGSEPPSGLARELATLVLLTATSVVVPDRVAPSAQGGIGICFYRGDKYADIECFNEGEILATISDGSGMPQIWEVKPVEIRDVLERIAEYINS